MISSVVGDEVVAIEDDFEKRTYEEDELHREFCVSESWIAYNVLEFSFALLYVTLEF